MSFRKKIEALLIAKDEQIWAVMKFNCMRCHEDKPLSEATQLEYPLQFNQKMKFNQKMNSETLTVEVSQKWAIVCRKCLSEITSKEGEK